MTAGKLIAELRKEKGLTQAGLAEQMGVTDKAVSKWERDLSFPDINSVPKLAEILGVTVEQLVQGERYESDREHEESSIKEEKMISESEEMTSESKEGKADPGSENKLREVKNLTMKAIPLAMGIAVTVLMVLGEIDTESALIMLGIGLSVLSLYLLQDK